MTEKRYYKKEWEESYYIFDSNTISEDEFEERVEYEGYDVFGDSLTGDEVIDLLNENEELISIKCFADKHSKGENEELKQQIKLLKLALCEELQDNGNAFFIRIFDDLFGLNYDEWESKHEYPDWEKILKNKKEYGD